MKYLRNSGKLKKNNPKPDISNAEPTPKRTNKEFKRYPHISTVPSIPAGEDGTSYQRNQKLLLSEEKKLNPNKNTVDVLMERTFVSGGKKL